MSDDRFPRRVAASKRVEWVVRPPDPGVKDGDEYDRYENDRLAVMRLIEKECGHRQPRDLRVIELPEETIISYETGRLVRQDDGTWKPDRLSHHQEGSFT